jgi:tetratricopeptide (TPR) repeat protein
LNGSGLAAPSQAADSPGDGRRRSRLLQSGTLLVLALLIVLGLVLIVRPAMLSGAAGDPATRAGDIALSGGDYRTALARFEDALAEAPDHRGALMGRAIARMHMGDGAGAETEFTQLIERLRRTLAADDTTGRGALAAAYANRGIVRDRDGRVADALADYRAALAIDATAVAGPGLIDRVLYGNPQASSVAKRARYLERELAKPEAERLLHLPAQDSRERMHKP